MVYYNFIKVIINISGQIKVIFNVVIYHYEVPESIIINWGLLFTSKFWSLLYYFLKIKKGYL